MWSQKYTNKINIPNIFIFSSLTLRIGITIKYKYTFSLCSPGWGRSTVKCRSWFLQMLYLAFSEASSWNSPEMQFALQYLFYSLGGTWILWDLWNVTSTINVIKPAELYLNVCITSLGYWYFKKALKYKYLGWIFFQWASEDCFWRIVLCVQLAHATV